jgi:hypothetical protein
MSLIQTINQIQIKYFYKNILLKGDYKENIDYKEVTYEESKISCL